MLIAHLNALDSLSRMLLALTAGVLTLFAFAPFTIYPLAVIGPSMLFLLWQGATPRQAMKEGWWFGVGLLGFGVSWMHLSIDQFGNVGTPLAILITLVFIAAMALYFALAGWFSRRYFQTVSPQLQLLVLFPATWVLSEWLRGWVLSGFPWLALGYSQIDSPLSGFAPLAGVYSVSATVVLSAGLLVLAYTDRRIKPLWPLLLTCAVWIGGYLLGTIDWTRDTGEHLRVSLVQGNIDQNEKWKRENLLPTLDLYRDLTRQHWQSNLVVWPETAVPAFLHRADEPFLEPLQREAVERGSALLLGIPVWDDEGASYYNALLSMGESRDLYYKRHLVPFGEFMPLKGLIGPLLEWIEIPMSDFSAGSATRPLIEVAGESVGVSICYEDAFGHEVIEAIPEARYLVNVSNDAWFGDSLALPQHLEIARMRALETGRFLLRSTNTGISAVIDQKGRLTGRSPAFEPHVLTRDIVLFEGSSPYAHYGNWPLILFLTGLLLLLLISRWRHP